GVGWPPRLCTVAVPGRRAARTGPGAAAGGVHRRAAGPGQHLLVLTRGARGDRAALAGGTMVQAPVAGTREGTDGRWWSASPSVDQRDHGDRGARHLDVVQECLHGEPELLLHLLSDRYIRGLRAGVAAVAVPVPRRPGGGVAAWRPPGRPLRPPRDHLVFDPWRRALHAGAAVRQ